MEKYDKGKEMILKGYLQPLRDKQQTKTAHVMNMGSVCTGLETFGT